MTKCKFRELPVNQNFKFDFTITLFSEAKNLRNFVRIRLTFSRIRQKFVKSQNFILAITYSLKCNLGQTICKLLHVLAQFLFTTIKTELAYYQLKVEVNVRSRSQFPERLRTNDLRKLENFKKIPEMI